MGKPSTGKGRRTIKRRRQQRRILIACEGAKEVQYFRHMSKRLGGTVVLRPVHDWSAPEHVLNLALSKRRDDQAAARASGDPADVYDEVWMVVDVDQHPKLLQTLGVAEKEGIACALSNPCFEVWLILHYTDCRAPLTGPQEAKDLWVKLAGKRRPVPQEFATLNGHFTDALNRADQVLARHERDGTPRHQRNPSTEVGLLLRQAVGDPRLLNQDL
jgi:hypothetical protein